MWLPDQAQWASESVAEEMVCAQERLALLLQDSGTYLPLRTAFYKGARCFLSPLRKKRHNSLTVLLYPTRALSPQRRVIYDVSDLYTTATEHLKPIFLCLLRVDFKHTQNIMFRVEKLTSFQNNVRCSCALLLKFLLVL